MMALPGHQLCAQQLLWQRSQEDAGLLFLPVFNTPAIQ